MIALLVGIPAFLLLALIIVPIVTVLEEGILDSIIGLSMFFFAAWGIGTIIMDMWGK